MVIALAIGIIAATVHFRAAANSGGLSDFSSVWFGSSVLRAGGNPYELIGPHRLIGLPWPMYYPVPALVAVLPLTFFSFPVASAIFVFGSAGLLAFGATRDGWQLLPIFPSVVFLTSAQTGQWSIITTASVFLPALAALSVAKPQGAIPILGSTTDRRTLIAGVVGGVALVLSSFVLFPGWVPFWIETIHGVTDYQSPIVTFGGPAIAVVLMRWKRPEAWLIFLGACLPQTWYPYNGLFLLVVAHTYREACVLSLVSSVGWLVAYLFFVGEWRSEETRLVMRGVLVAACYLPAVLVVLRRPNQGFGPLWISSLKSFR